MNEQGWLRMDKIAAEYNRNLKKVEKCSIWGMIVKVIGFLISITRNFTILFYFLLILVSFSGASAREAR